MLARCRHCGRAIRDCSAFENDGFSRVPVIAWYHVATGYENCHARPTMAEPVPLLAVRCPIHPGRPENACPMCQAYPLVMAFFHVEGRCIPALCPHPHA